MTNMQRTIWYSILFVVGVGLVVLGVLEYVDSYISGVGGALAGVAAIRLVQEMRRAKDPAYAKKVATRHADERNAYIAGKSASLTFRASVVLLALASLVLRPLGYAQTASVLLVVMALEVVVYLVSYMVISRKS